MAKIRINGDTSGYIEISAPNVAGSTSITLPATTGGNFLVTDSSGNLNVDSGTLYVDATNNRVGIGTSSPSNNFQVTFSATAAVPSAGASGNCFAVGSSAYGITGGALTNGNSYFQVTRWDGTATNYDLLLQPNGGRVGIGTSTFSVGTSNELSVNGSSSSSVSLKRGDALAGYVGCTSSQMVVNSVSNLPLLFYTNDTERARIDTSGRFLVGTSSTSGNATLHVNKGSAAGTDAGGLLLTNMAAMSSIGAGDDLGYINFGATTTGGVASYDAARILCEADATWGTNDYPSRIVFSTTADAASSPTERMRIRNNGEILFGGITSIATYNQGVGFGDLSATTSYMRIGHNQTGAAYSYIAFGFNTGDIGSIVQNSAGTAVAYNTTSDYRLKENVTLLTGATNRLKQLPVHRFNFISDPDHTVDGFLAHEAQVIVPECVTGEKDEVDADGNPVYQGIDQSKLVPLLTAALQEAVIKIEQLEATNASFEARLSALEVKP